MDKIRQNLNTNSRLIHSERARVELISRMVGAPFDALSISDKPRSTKKPMPVGGSAVLGSGGGGQLISCEREQRDASLYKMLFGGTDKVGTPKIPVVRASKTLSKLLEVDAQPVMTKQQKDAHETTRLTPRGKFCLLNLKYFQLECVHRLFYFQCHQGS